MKDLRKIVEEPAASLEVHKLVLEYLNHYAYLGTLDSFVLESGISRIEGSTSATATKASDELGLLKKHDRQYCTSLLPSLCASA